MTVYVDDWQQEARVGRLNAVWSHLFCGPFDDLAELHEMAARIGMQHRWFQAKPWPRAHYDVTAPKRLQAIRAGAVAISWRQTGEQIARARQAWRAVAGELPAARTPDGKPPGRDDVWQAAAIRYKTGWPAEMATALVDEGQGSLFGGGAA